MQTETDTLAAGEESYEAPEGFFREYQRLYRDPALPSQLSGLLSLVGYAASEETIWAWPKWKRVQLEAYAVNVHLRANDNAIRKHPRPRWLPEPWQGPWQGEGAFEGPGGTVLP